MVKVPRATEPPTAPTISTSPSPERRVKFSATPPDVPSIVPETSTSPEVFPATVDKVIVKPSPRTTLSFIAIFCSAVTISAFKAVAAEPLRVTDASPAPVI